MTSVIKQTPNGTIIVEDVNPMFVLIGSTLKTGHSMLCADLCEFVKDDLQRIIDAHPCMHGFTPGSAAFVIDSMVKETAHSGYHTLSDDYTE